MTPSNHHRRDQDEEQSSLKKSPSIQDETSTRSNPFYDETKSSFLYPHAQQESNSTGTTISTSQVKTLNTPFSNFSRSELNVSTPISTRLDQTLPDTDHPYFESTTPSMLLRSLFIQQEQLQPVQTSTLRIRRAFDIDEIDHSFSSSIKISEPISLPLSTDKLEEKYSVTSQTPIAKDRSQQKDETSAKKIVNVNDSDFSVNSRVIVNTDHQIFNKLGTIRFIGKTYFKEGIWYGIELEEPVGKY